MLLYARRSGLMLVSVLGHVLSHVCGHVRSVCPLLGMPMFKHNDRDAPAAGLTIYHYLPLSNLMYLSLLCTAY